MSKRISDFKWSSFSRIILALVLALGIGFIITLIFSKQPVFAYYSFLTGPLQFLNRFGDWIEDAITLTLLGLAVSVAFSANQTLLGAEGQMTLGALASGIVVLYLPLPGMLLIPVALLAAIIFGTAWGAIPGILKARLQANELVSSLMLN